MLMVNNHTTDIERHVNGIHRCAYVKVIQSCLGLCGEALLEVNFKQTRRVSGIMFLAR